jgi:hypothetical protein
VGVRGESRRGGLGLDTRDSSAQTRPTAAAARSFGAALIIAATILTVVALVPEIGERWQEYTARHGPPDRLTALKRIGLGLLSLTGGPPIVEAIRGRRLLSDQPLEPAARWALGIGGVVQAALFLVGVRVGLAGGAKETPAELVAALRRQGVKHTPEAIVRIEHMPDGRIVFLEQGKVNVKRESGLAHILKKHEKQFADLGITRDAIPEFVFKLLREAEAIGKHGGDGVVYRTVVNGETRHFVIVVSDNGYIVTAYPLRQRHLKKVRPLR